MTKEAAVSGEKSARVSRRAEESAMAAQLWPSVLGTPGRTRPFGPARVDEVQAEVPERAERAEVPERADRAEADRDLVRRLVVVWADGACGCAAV